MHPPTPVAQASTPRQRRRWARLAGLRLLVGLLTCDLLDRLAWGLLTWCELNPALPSHLTDFVLRPPGSVPANFAYRHAKPRRPLTAKDHPTRTFNLYLSSEMYDFLQGLANQCGNSKKGVLSLLTCDYFGILPLALSNPGKSQ